MLIGGEWVDARSGETFESVDPFTGRVWAEIANAGPEDVDAAVRAARARAVADGRGFIGRHRAAASPRPARRSRIATCCE